MKMKRIEWVDRVRAFAMISVVLGHALGQINEDVFLNRWLYLFHVPLCVIISGYLFKEKDNLKQSMNYVKKILIREYIPYLFWGFFSIVVYLIVIDHSNLMTNAANFLKGLFFGNGSLGRGSGDKGYMVWNTPLWYLPCIIVIEFISAFLSLIKFKYSKAVIFACSIALAFSCYHFLNLHIWFMEFESAIYLLPFFWFGMVLREGEVFIDRLLKNKIIVIAFSVFLIAAGSVVGFINGSPIYLTDVYRSSYILFFFSSALIGMGIMELERGLAYRSRPVAYIGRNTMTLLVFHKFPIMVASMFISKLLKVKVTNEPLIVVVGIVITVIAVAVSLVAAVLFTKAAPVLIGKTRNKKRFSK